VALKQILDHHADDPASRQRFLMEAEITGGLEHPRIVPVYGLGTYAGGRPYYAMRLIKGESLKQAIEHFHKDESLKNNPRSRSLELRKLLRRFTDVCNAIDYAHSRGVLHRDIKPSNIILGKHGETLVVDWGLAKAMGRSVPSAKSGERTLTPSSGSGVAETLPGLALGTPAYMSPEQAAGDPDRLESRSDVYSLGATLYTLLTGRPPYEGDVGAVLNAVQKGDSTTPRRIDPSIDLALEAVCLTAMALEPTDRYSTALALADAVDRWLADEAVVARPDGWGGRLVRWSRHHRAWVRAGAAALVLVTSISVFAWVQLRASQQGNLKLTASLGLARGQSLCDQGLTGEGLLWLTRALRLCPGSEVELKRDIRENIGYRIDQVHGLNAQTVLPSAITALAFSPDGKTAVSCNENGPALLWDSDDGRSIGPPLDGQDGVLSLAFAPDGRTVLTGGRDGTARFWDTRTGSGVGPVLQFGKAVMCLTFSPDGRLVAAGGSGNKARVWEVATGRQILEDLTHPPNPGWDGFLGDVVFSSDGRRLFTASRDGTFRLWNTSDGTLIGPGGKHPTFALTASLSGDGRQLLTVGPTGGQIWDVETGRTEGPLLTHHGAALAGAFHPVKPWVAIGFEDGSVSIWDAASRPYKLLARTEQGGSVRRVAFTPAGRSLVTANDDGTARLWEVPSGRPLGGPFYHPRKQSVTCLAVSPDGRGMLTGCQDGVSRSWRFGQSRSLSPGLSHGADVWYVAFSPDGRFGLTGGEQQMRGWDSRTGRPVGKPMELLYGKCAAFSPDGRFAVAGSYSGMVRLWDVCTGDVILERQLEPPGSFVSAAHGPGVSFSYRSWATGRSQRSIPKARRSTTDGRPEEMIEWPC
jgi:WD40 repeat protein